MICGSQNTNKMFQTSLIGADGKPISETNDCAYLQVSLIDGSSESVALISPKALYEYLLSVNVS